MIIDDVICKDEEIEEKINVKNCYACEHLRTFDVSFTTRAGEKKNGTRRECYLNMPEFFDLMDCDTHDCGMYEETDDEL